MIIKTSIFLALFFLTLSCAQTSERAMMIYGGEEIYRDQLPDAYRSQIYTAQNKYYESVVDALKDAVIDRYLTALAQERNSDLKGMKTLFLPVYKPSEKEAKAYFEKVKDAFPYSYSLAKGEIKKLMAVERLQEHRQRLLARIAKEKKVKLYLVKPKPMVTEIDTTGYPSKGPKTAKITLVEFGDFTCPNCKLMAPKLEKLLKKYPKHVRLVWRYFMLHEYGGSKTLAIASQCAHQQGKFWQFHELVFKDQMKYMWGSSDKLVKPLGLDKKAFDLCKKAEATKDLVQKSHDEGIQKGVAGTPAFFVNGKRVKTPNGINSLDREIQLQLSKK